MKQYIKRDWDNSKRNCINCNKIFLPRQPNNNYCSVDCRLKFNKIKNTSGKITEIKKNCLWCNKIMILPANYAGQKYCNAECREQYWKVEKAKEPNKIKLKNVKCVICGNIFLQKSFNQITCSIECRREKSRRYAITNPSYKRKQRRKSNFTNFNNLEFYNEEDFHHWFELNYSLFGLKKLIKSDRFFPDVIAETFDGVQLRIELELVSNNFVNHGHNPDECDLIICFVSSRKSKTIKGVPVISVFYSDRIGHQGDNNYDNKTLELTEHFDDIQNLSNKLIKKYTELLNL